MKCEDSFGRLRRLAGIAVMAVLCASPALAQGVGGPSRTATSPDITFATQALQAGIAEVQEGRLALRNGTAAVRPFANQMITDHSAINGQIAGLLIQKNIMKEPDIRAMKPDPADQQAMAQLATLHGATFDTAYAHHQVADHQQAIALFKSEITNGSDADFKALAANTLPILQHHLQMAQQLAGMPAASGTQSGNASYGGGTNGNAGPIVTPTP